MGIQNRKTGESALHAAARTQSVVACKRLLAKPRGEEAAELKDVRLRTGRDVARRSGCQLVCDIFPGTKQKACTFVSGSSAIPGAWTPQFQDSWQLGIDNWSRAE